MDIVFTVNIVSELPTTGMRIIAGRALNDRDLPNGPKVAVVNRTLAANYFTDGQAIGRHSAIRRRTSDCRNRGRRPPLRFRCAGAFGFFSIVAARVAVRQLDIRTKGDPKLVAARCGGGVIASSRPANREHRDDGGAYLAGTESGAADCVADLRVRDWQSPGFASLAAVTRWFVARPSSARMALGAPRQSVLWSVVREAPGSSRSVACLAARCSRAVTWCRSCSSA